LELQLEQVEPAEETNLPLEEKPKTEKILSPSPPQLGQDIFTCLFKIKNSNLHLHFLQIYSYMGISFELIKSIIHTEIDYLKIY